MLISWPGYLAWLWFEGLVSLPFHADLTVDGFDSELCSTFSYISKKIIPISKMGVGWGGALDLRGGYFCSGRN